MVNSTSWSQEDPKNVYEGGEITTLGGEVTVREPYSKALHSMKGVTSTAANGSEESFTENVDGEPSWAQSAADSVMFRPFASSSTRLKKIFVLKPTGLERSYPYWGWFRAVLSRMEYSVVMPVCFYSAGRTRGIQFSLCAVNVKQLVKRM